MSRDDAQPVIYRRRRTQKLRFGDIMCLINVYVCYVVGDPAYLHTWSYIDTCIDCTALDCTSLLPCITSPYGRLYYCTALHCIALRYIPTGTQTYIHILPVHPCGNTLPSLLPMTNQNAKQVQLILWKYSEYELHVSWCQWCEKKGKNVISFLTTFLEPASPPPCG